MTQQVPSACFFENIVEDHNYTMFSMYSQPTNLIDTWQFAKDDKNMVSGIMKSDHKFKICIVAS